MYVIDYLYSEYIKITAGGQEQNGCNIYRGTHYRIKVKKRCIRI